MVLCTEWADEASFRTHDTEGFLERVKLDEELRLEVQPAA